MKNSKYALIIMSLLVLSLMVSACARPEEVMSEVEQDKVETVTGQKTNETAKEEGVTTVKEEKITVKDETQKDAGEKKDIISEASGDPVEVADYQVFKPNEVGDIIVVMYHGIMDNPPYHRTLENFQKDLQYMYDNGYRLITLKEYMTQDIDIDVGCTPILLTFDDGLSSTFSLENINGELTVKEGTAIGQIEAFCEKNPDFGKGAVLYINGGMTTTFKGDGTYEERLTWLVEHGYDLGNHLYSHPYLNKLNGVEVQKEIGLVDEQVNNVLDGYDLNSISYPFGVRPNENDRQYIESGSYEGYNYEYKLAFREAYRNALMPPHHVDFEPFNCSRVRGNEGEFGEVWWAFEMYENHPERKYISDGDINTIVVPIDKAQLVNIDAIGDKELITYE